MLSGIWTLTRPLGDIDVRSTLVLGERTALVFDTLLHPSDMTPFAGLVGERELVTVYSHADWDHIWGTAGLPGRGGSVVGHASCARRFAIEAPATLAEKRGSQPREYDDVRLVPPATLFESFTAIDVGPWSVELHHTPGHTPDSIVAWIPAAGVLLGGDAFENPAPFVNDREDIAAWMTGLRRWADEPGLKAAVPAHGEISDRTLLERNIAFLHAESDE